jgi:hypothetical protein
MRHLQLKNRAKGIIDLGHACGGKNTQAGKEPTVVDHTTLLALRDRVLCQTPFARRNKDAAGQQFLPNPWW